MPQRARSARGKSPARPGASSRATCHTPPAFSAPMSNSTMAPKSLPVPPSANGTVGQEKSEQKADKGIDVTAYGFIGKISIVLVRVLAFLSALLLSPPVWCCIFLCGPHMPNLFVPTLLAAALRLGMVFFNLVQKAFDDGLLEPWEFFCVLFRFLLDVLVTAYAVFPQPVFTTVVGGPFTSGDAARASHMRASRWLWRTTVDFPALEMVLPLAVLCYILIKYRLCRNLEVPGLTFLNRVPSWLLSLMWGAVGSVFYTAFAARMKMLPLAYLLGSDVSATLASVIPDWALMFRRELSLYHCFLPGWPFAWIGCNASWFTAVLVSVGDALMSNPGVPGVGGFVGSCMFFIGMTLADQQLMSGFWLGAAAWFMRFFCDYFFDESLTPETSVDIWGVFTVELEDDDGDPGDKAVGPLTSQANLAIKIPWTDIEMPFDRPFKVAAVILFIFAWWVAPYTLYAWVIWAGAWMVLGSSTKCCLEWLPNNGD